MRAFSKNDHLQYGFTATFENDAPNSIFHIGIGDLGKSPESFLNECIYAALDIQNRALGKDIYLTLSGGIDSECVLRSFLAAKVPFKIIILKLNDDLNWHDVDSAVHLCSLLDLDYQTFQLNLFEFYSKELHLHYARRYKLASPMIATHLKLAEFIISELNGVPIFSGDFTRLNANRKSQGVSQEVVNDLVAIPSEWTFSSFATQDHFSLDLLFHDLNKFGVANFYLYSPEQIAASIRIGLSPDLKSIENAVTNGRDVSLGGPKTISSFYDSQVEINKLKELFFKFGGFETLQHFSKWTGFELVHEFYFDQNLKNGRLMQPFGNFEKKIQGMNNYNELFRLPMKRIARQIHLKKF